MLLHALGTAVLAVLILLGSACPALAVVPNLEALADSLTSLRLDPAMQAEVSQLEIVRAGVRISLDKGVFTMGTPVAGRVVSAVFVGKGRFQLTPPNRAETYMLIRHTQDSTINWEFKEIALVFTDSTFQELAAKLTFKNVNSAKDELRLQQGFIDYIRHEFEMSFAAFVLNDLFNPALDGRFMARFSTQRGTFVFNYDPKEIEEVQLFKHITSESGSGPDFIQSFHSPDQYADSRWGPEKENKDLIDSLDYDISCKIHQSAKTDLDVKLSFISNVDNLRSVFFQLMPEIDYSSLVIHDLDGDSLSWLREKDEYGVTIFFDKPLSKSQRLGLRCEYSSGRMVGKTPWGGNILTYATTWYPRYGYLKRAKHKLRFAVPEQYEVVSVGRKTSETVADGFKITDWDISEFPVAIVSYNYGPFDIDTGSILGKVPVAVYAGKSHRAATAPMREAVLLDIVASASLFSAEVHPYPFNQLIATEIPSPHGQGLPGLLHLGYATFDFGLADNTDDAFRAHEVAHQWWGHLVGWKSYHDQWLSEAFAEYFGGWYVQRKYQNDEQNRGRFFQLLDTWREDVFEKGSYTNRGAQTAYQEGNDAGPIWMGQRLASSKSSDYSTLVYSKGAYVLYMLRMMMFDFVKRDDSKFKEMLNGFLREHKWQDATTGDFQKVAEKFYGKPLDWFFDQWVYDTQLPEYTWEPVVSQQSDGKYSVDLKVKVENVREGFRMVVPLTILMAGDYHTTTRLDINQLNQTLTIPNLPHKPEKFVFNTFKSVLCREHAK